MVTSQNLTTSLDRQSLIRKVYHQAQEWKMGSTKGIITCYSNTRRILTGAHKRPGLEKSTLDQGQGLKKGHTGKTSIYV